MAMVHHDVATYRDRWRMREAKDSVRPATKAQIVEFAQRARDAETKEQILTAFAEVILRNARQHWVEEFWPIIRR